MDQQFANLITEFNPVFKVEDFGVKSANTVVNVIFISDGNIDLERLARVFPEVEYDSNDFAAAIIRELPPESCCLAFSICKLIFSGLKTLNQNICTTQKHAELIAENGSDVKRIFAKTMNRVVCYNTGYPINLQKLSEKSPFNIKYEPDVFPACSIELDEKWGVKKASVFGSGKVNLTGVPDEQSAKITFQYLEETLKNYKLSDEEVKNLLKKKKNGNQLKSAKTKKQKETAKSSASITESNNNNNNNNNSISPVLKINKLESMEELFNGGSSSQEKPIVVNKESNTTLIIEKPPTKTENSNKRKLDSVDLSLLDDMIESTNTFTYEQQTVLPIVNEHVESGISKIKIEQSFKRRNTMHIVGRKK